MIRIMCVVTQDVDLPSAALVVAHTSELHLYAVHTVDTVNEQDQDEDERYLATS